jgi:FG-GAP-like repeat
VASVIYESGGYQADSLAVADANGDGKLDVVVGHTGNAKVGVLLGAGDGTFQPAVSFSAGGEVGSVAVADVNGDNRPDLLAATADGVALLLNNTPFCTTPPVVTLSSDRTSLWPPNGSMVPVTFSGRITDMTGCSVMSATYGVTDEYGQVQPSGPVTLGATGAYSFTVWLKASRTGTDLDGRLYMVTVSASNDAGKTGSQAGTIVVPHDQGQ